MTNREWSLQKKIIVAILAIAAVFAAVLGIVYAISTSNQEDVLVIPVYDADYGSEDEDSGTIEGTISTGATQTITYDSTRRIVEIKVKEGDHVKKGDTLVVYDSSKTSDEIEQRTLDVKTAELAIKQLQRTIDKLNGAVEMVVPEDNDGSSDSDYDGEEGDNDGMDPALKSRKSRFEDEEDEEFEDDGDEDYDESDEDYSDEEEDDGSIDLSDYDPGETVYVDSDGEVYSVVDMRKAKLSAENEMRTLNTDLAEANEDLAEATGSLSNSDAVATIDGVVTSVNITVESQPPADAGDVGDAGDQTIVGGMGQPGSMDGLPVLTVSSFDGIFVNTAVSEWQRESLSEGDYIYVTDWSTDEVYPAKITQIATYASESMTLMYGDDETNDSYYPLTALIEEDGTGLSSGDSVDVTLYKPEEYDDGEDEDEEDEPIYLYKAFVVSEGNNKYVYKEDKEGKLKKQKLTVDGQERETYIVTGGITEDDYIAFPFGDNIKEGANTVRGEMDQLYEDY